MTALDEILTWSASAPTWLRDALRRIVGSPELSASDIAELTELCKSPHGLSSITPSANCLAPNHIPAPTTSGSVAVTSITHVADVNALAPNETLTAASTGLTIVYGDNGAGKSGYTRILRRACRARGSETPILANALSDKPAGAPTARIEYTVAGVPHAHTWKDGTPADAELSAISVFDTASAQVYIEEKTEVRFRPFGLDTTDRAAAACALVKKSLEAEIELQRARTVRLPVLAANTEVGRLLAGLTALTPHSEVDRLGTMRQDEEEECATLRALAAAAKIEDPKKRALELRQCAGRLRRLLDRLREIASALTDDRLDQLAALTSQATNASTEADQFAKEFAREMTLSGVGTSEWTSMWKAATAYSEKRAYAEHTFPHVADGAVCVLCQQKLAMDAQARMRRLQEFAVGAAQEAARRKAEEADRVRRAVIEIRPKERTDDALAELEALDQSLAEKVNVFIASAVACHSDVVAAASQPRRCGASVPVVELEATIADIERKAEAFLQASDPTARARAEQRLLELEARAALGSALVDVHDEIDRRARLNAYEQCLKDTDTRALTKLGGELTKKYVTDTLTAAFAAELESLGFNALELELKPAGAQRGQLMHRVQLKHATRAELPRVVSEGESRCIALAAFMAELHSAGHKSAIVFDDPVSSLDHRWRSSVAGRLVKAAASRQVIVFTHELVFLAALLQQADKAGIPAETRTLTRDRAHAGHVADGLPWHGMPTKKRIGLLRERWAKAEKTFRTVGQDEYDPVATTIYADLRRTWERAIEEVLLNGVVLRFRPGIETNRLKKIGDITITDLEAVENGMTKSSKWEGGHDQPSAMNERLPPPAELKQDIDDLDAWVSAVDKRRR